MRRQGVQGEERERGERGKNVRDYDALLKCMKTNKSCIPCICAEWKMQRGEKTENERRCDLALKQEKEELVKRKKREKHYYWETHRQSTYIGTECERRKAILLSYCYICGERRGE